MKSQFFQKAFLEAKLTKARAAPARLWSMPGNGRYCSEVEVGAVEGLGLEGYKSTDLARRRVEQWEKADR